MTRQGSANRLLRLTALAGYGMAATAGAVTVGLIAGVAHTAANASTKSTGTTTSTSEDDTTAKSGSTANSSTGGSSTTVTPTQQSTTPVAGSHGS